MLGILFARTDICVAVKTAYGAACVGKAGAVGVICGFFAADGKADAAWTH